MPFSEGREIFVVYWGYARVRACLRDRRRKLDGTSGVSKRTFTAVSVRKLRDTRTFYSARTANTRFAEKVLSPA